jgi:PAS domain S-box-containing protein
MIMTDEVAAHHDQYVENYLTTGVKKMIGKQREVIARRKDGSTFPAALGLAEPQAAGLICGFIRDLTQEKAAQAEIIAKQNFTSKIIDASFDALFVINEHGIIKMVNEQSTKALGWSRDEFIGKNISMIMPEEHSAKHDGYLARYLETGVKKMMGTEREVEARCKDGSSFPCVLGLKEVETNSEGERMFCGFIRSLAREKTLEKRFSDEAAANIRNAKQILEQKSTILGILDASFHALFVITEERIIQMVNQKSCDVFGWTKEEFIGKNIR